MRRYAFRVAIVVCVLAVSPAAGWSTGLAARSDAFHWSNAKWATFLPTASDLATTFTVPNILFNTPRDFQCREPTCGPYSILGPGNDVLGAQNAFLDGARMYFFGHEYNGHNLSSGVPAIWIAVALFHDDSEAQLVQRGLEVLPPTEIKSETVTFRPDIGTVPAEDAVIYATNPIVYGGTIEFLSYTQSNLVVEIWMANPDSQTVLRLGKEIDQKAIAAGFTR